MRTLNKRAASLEERAHDDRAYLLHGRAFPELCYAREYLIEEHAHEIASPATLG